MPIWLAILCSIGFTSFMITCVVYADRWFPGNEGDLPDNDPFLIDMRISRLEPECTPQELVAVMLHHRYLDRAKDLLAGAPHGDDVLMKLDVASAIRNTHATCLLRKQIKKVRRKIFIR